MNRCFMSMVRNLPYLGASLVCFAAGAYGQAVVPNSEICVVDQVACVNYVGRGYVSYYSCMAAYSSVLESCWTRPVFEHSACEQEAEQLFSDPQLICFGTADTSEPVAVKVTTSSDIDI